MRFKTMHTIIILRKKIFKQKANVSNYSYRIITTCYRAYLPMPYITYSIFSIFSYHVSEIIVTVLPTTTIRKRLILCASRAALECASIRNQDVH